MPFFGILSPKKRSSFLCLQEEVYQKSPILVKIRPARFFFKSGQKSTNFSSFSPGFTPAGPGSSGIPQSKFSPKAAKRAPEQRSGEWKNSGGNRASYSALGPAATTSALMWVYFLKFSTKLLASFWQLAL